MFSSVWPMWTYCTRLSVENSGIRMPMVRAPMVANISLTRSYSVWRGTAAWVYGEYPRYEDSKMLTLYLRLNRWHGVNMAVLLVYGRETEIFASIDICIQYRLAAHAVSHCNAALSLFSLDGTYLCYKGTTVGPEAYFIFWWIDDDDIYLSLIHIWRCRRRG